ncbi:MAG: carotenoid oxygenase family protein [Rhodobacteraceae bacterium]|nr:carotenoid oxygenase family protein [Paracoccaceae bacterium]
MAIDHLSRRAMLGALASLPALSGLGALAGTREEFNAGLSKNPHLLGLANAKMESFDSGMKKLRGHLPSGLEGVLWRNGPAEHERFGDRYTHWFDGDGMVQAYTLSGDRVTHRARILDTPKRRRETREGRRYIPAFGTAGSGPMSGPDDMNVANTSMLFHAGQLLALWEGGSALEVDPETLGAGKFKAWHPELSGLPFSAHPRVEKDGTLWNTGAIFFPQEALLIYRIHQNGTIVKANLLDVGPMGIVHDFVVTSRHIVVLLTPLVIDPDLWSDRDVSFLDAHVWRPAYGTRVLTIDKNQLEIVRRHELPPGFHFHHGNGWEEADGTIHLDVCQAPGPEFVTRDMREVMCGQLNFSSAHPRYSSIVLPPRSGAEINVLAPGPVEFPRIDSRRTGQRHRMVFALTGDEVDGKWPFNRVIRIDPELGETDGWTYPGHQIPEEHVFVPAGPAEGEGWLLGPYLDVRRKATGLNVFNARHVSAGPLWEGILPYFIPLGLHGTFAAL